ncbi:MAG: glycosyltransferase family 2 protein [Candidatus Shapirobacteria bacterium]|nr:glycosyltransferase family 2 protein [Candidatus Shapirobacteria bacterium]
MNQISIVIPIYNAESTIFLTLKSLIPEAHLIDEIIIINDGSTDKSIEIINNFFKRNLSKINKKIINHPKSIGLSNSYNEGILQSNGDLIITLHADIILKKNAIALLIAPFSQKTVVASYHQIIHPKKIWQKYNFWQKVFFDRKIGLTISGLDGKFDCFRRKDLLAVNLFDSKNYFRAGEDHDIFIKLKKRGRVVPTKATIIHIHSFEKNFNYKKIIYKQAQYSEAQGANLRKHGIYSLELSLRTFFREILVLSLLFPYLRMVGLFLIFLYAFIYNKNTLKISLHNPQILVLPFINIYLLFISLFFSCRGFILGKQTI